jgi:hypothetical protein
MLIFLLCAQLAASTPGVDTTYATPALRALVTRAAEENRSPPPDFRSYRSHIETELSLLLRDTLGREHTAQVEQLASVATWTRGGRYDLHVVGYRSQTIGVPYSALSIVRAWTIPSLYGNRLALGAYFNTSRRQRDTLIAVHPFAADRDSFYTFTGGDTVTTLRVGERRIPIVRIHVRPSFQGTTRLGAFDGEIDLDADRAQIVRMRGQFVTLGGKAPPTLSRVMRAASGVVAVAYGEFVNAEIDGKYWLPSFQRTEFQASMAVLGRARPIFRLVSNIDGIAVTSGDSALDSTYTPRVTISWAPTDSVDQYRNWERGLGTQSGSVHSDDFDDLAPDVWRPTGAPRLNLFPNSTSRIVRFNRVEGLFTGVAPSIDFRSVAPGLTTGAYVGWAWSEQTARGGVFSSYTRGKSIWGVRAERVLASTNDFSLPFTNDPGMFAILSSVDNSDYVDRRTAMVSLTRVLRSVDVGLATFQFGVGDDRSERSRIAHGLISSSRFLENRGAADGRYAIGSADLELHPNVTGDFVQPGIGLRARYEAAAGDLDWQRVELSLAGRKYFGPISVAAHADGGLVLGSAPPPQKLFELGGDDALPGYRFKEFVGDRAALFRTIASYRFGVWRRPIHIWRNLMLPGVSPGFAVSAQGGWTELSSLGARTSAIALGDKDGEPVSAATQGIRSVVGGGLTLFSDLIHIGAARPVDHPARWRFVIGYGAAF